MNKSFYIVPTFNKDYLIISVLKGILNCHDKETNPPIIICIIDGCTDNTKELVNNFKNKYEHPDNIHILYLNNVHEITCLNFALEYIEKNLNPNDEDLIFSIQDDVILEEENINTKFNRLFNYKKNLGYVSMRLGTKINVHDNQIIEYDFIESEFGHWNQLNFSFHKTLKHLQLAFVEIGIRSPTCTLWKRFKEVGFFDINLAPYGFDCHDFSIRMNKAEYINAVFALRFKSDVNWGTMRSKNLSEYNNNINEIHIKNRTYLANKHKDYFNNKKEFDSSFLNIQF